MKNLPIRCRLGIVALGKNFHDMESLNNQKEMYTNEVLVKIWNTHFQK